MDFGLSANSRIKLVKLFEMVPEIECVKVFGSRALGTNREGSDIDFALYGQRITPEILRDLSIWYYDLNLPYQLDLVHYEGIINPELKKHIDLYGVSFTAA